MSVTSIIQKWNRMRRIILPSVACQAMLYSYTLSQKGTIFETKNVTEHKMCVLIFSKNPAVENISHSKKNSARYDHKCTSIFM